MSLLANRRAVPTVKTTATTAAAATVAAIAITTAGTTGATADAARPPRSRGRFRRVIAGLAIAGLASVGLATTACSATQPITLEPVDVSTARIVGAVTGGIVGPAGPIIVRFVEPQIATERVGSTAEAAFRLYPAVAGSSVWIDERSIQFAPTRPLRSRSDYVAEIDLAAIIDPAVLAERDSTAFRFAFTVAGQEIRSYESTVVPIAAAGTQPTAVAVHAQLHFLLPEELDRVRSAVTMTIDGRRWPITIESGSDPQTFLIRSEPVARSATTQTAAVRIAVGALDLSTAPAFGGTAPSRGTTSAAAADTAPATEIVFPEQIAAIDEFTVSRIATIDDETGSSLRLEFSDELAAHQDLASAIAVEPAVPLRIRSAGNTVYVHGGFVRGEVYKLSIGGGIADKWGTVTEELVSKDIVIEDIKPKIAFAQAGSFLTTEGNGRIYVESVNVRRANVRVTQIFENNLGQFLQTEQLQAAATRNTGFDGYYTNRVGVVVAETTLEFGEHRNERLLHELDLTTLLDRSSTGLYLVSVSFEREDMIWTDDAGDSSDWYSDYYGNPMSYGYRSLHAQIFKPIMVTNIGLTWKAGRSTNVVFASDLISGQPLSGVRVRGFSYQNQVLLDGTTDVNGRVVLPAAYQRSNTSQGGGGDEAATGDPATPTPIFYLTGERAGQRTVIKAAEMGWNLSSFDIGGQAAAPDGVRVYAYSDRGVYRPGETVHLTTVARGPGIAPNSTATGSGSSGPPMRLTLRNPLGQTVIERAIDPGLSGVYHVAFSTADDAPTGTYQAEIKIGASESFVPVRVETIVAERLRVALVATPQTIGPDTRSVDIDIEANYLFGAPATGLPLEVEAITEHRAQTFAGYPGFSFVHQAVDFAPATMRVAATTLDQDGRNRSRFDLPAFDQVPSAADLVVRARVVESGGRDTRGVLRIPVDPYPVYVGVSKPDFAYGYATIGSAFSVPVVAVDHAGNALTRNVTYRIFKNSRYWWYEYDTYRSFQVRYKSDVDTAIVEEGSIVTGAVPQSILFTPDGWGEYYLEIEDPEGHRSGFFFRASSWSDNPLAQDEGILSLRTDRREYAPGETATVTIATPNAGSLLVTMERAGEVLSSFRQQVTSGETRIPVPIVAEMAPGVYIAVSLLQPHAQTTNDRPSRMYGVVPIRIVNPDSRVRPRVIVDPVLEPRRDFTVRVETGMADAAVTIAVVDEGLLSLTNFATPDPWGFFYAKQQLQVRTFDSYGHVIGAFRDDVFRAYAIGGAEAEPLLGDADADDTDRFEPVALHSGLLRTDARGTATVTFEMPNYLGAVRVMAVVIAAERYGSAAQTVPVRTDVVALPTLPRVIGPSERFEMPVGIMTTREGLGAITVGVRTSGPISVVGEQSVEIPAARAATAGLQEVFFELQTAAAIGPTVVTVTVQAGGRTWEYPTNLTVRAASPVISTRSVQSMAPGAVVRMIPRSDAIVGTAQLVVSINRFADINIDQRLQWLINYPYGCVEQIVSAVFPQTVMRTLFDSGVLSRGSNSRSRLEEIDRNVIAAITRLGRFQLSSGGFSYWPGETRVSPWGSNYAAHFLLTARSVGYAVPQSAIDNWTGYATDAAVAARDTMTTRVYRLYLLAIAGRPAISAMNLIRENHFVDLTDPEKWLLAAAYHLAGVPATARSILDNAGTRVDAYAQFSGTYGSDLRDTAMILEAAVRMGRAATAESLFERIAGPLSSDTWYSTQTLGYSLVAVGRYLDSITIPNQPIRGRIAIEGSAPIHFSLTGVSTDFNITNLVYGAGAATPRPVTVFIDQPTDLERAIVTFDWLGQPLRSDDPPVSDNLGVSVRYLSTTGNPINAFNVQQGQEFYALLQANTVGQVAQDVEEVALSFLLPSGWEVVNTRLTGEPDPVWAERLNLTPADYLDIRDDRVDWFFDLPRRSSTRSFLVKLQAVTVGSFRLPPTTLVAMYRNDYRARTVGRDIRVVR